VEDGEMVSRILGALFFGLFYGGSPGGFGKPQSHIHPVDPASVECSAPELDPSSLGGGVVVFAGGLLALNERRRKKNLKKK
jgi:hypothetical protein